MLRYLQTKLQEGESYESLNNYIAVRLTEQKAAGTSREADLLMGLTIPPDRFSVTEGTNWVIRKNFSCGENDLKGSFGFPFSFPYKLLLREDAFLIRVQML